MSLVFSVVCMSCFAGQDDYVVDALALHDHLHLLRPILADPAVLKVFPFSPVLSAMP